jgi:hypothetical protein
MSGQAKFSSERPSGDAWGIEAAVTRAMKEFLKTGHSPMIPVIGVITVKSVAVGVGEDGEGPTHTPTVAVKRIDALENPEAVKLAHRLIAQAIEERNEGRGVQMLKFDDQQVIKEAFGDMDAERLAEDDRELAEDEALTDPDRLRRHLVKVHGFAQDEIEQMEMFDVQKTHQAAHEPLSERVMPHDVEWWAWRDIVIRERAEELRTEGLRWDAADGDETETDQPPMDGLEEIRLHLINVHRFDADTLEGESLADVRHRHLADHQEHPNPGEEEDGFPTHDLAWLGGSADDLDAAEVVAEDDETAADVAADNETDKG